MNIQEYLSTKVKNSKALVTELKNSGDLFAEVQADYDNNAGYHTLDVTDGIKKYKYGFVTWNDDINSVCLLAFNKSEDFANLLGMENDWKDLEALNQGECYEKDNNELIIRIW